MGYEYIGKWSRQEFEVAMLVVAMETWDTIGIVIGIRKIQLP